MHPQEKCYGCSGGTEQASNSLRTLASDNLSKYVVRLHQVLLKVLVHEQFIIYIRFGERGMMHKVHVDDHHQRIL